MNFLYSDDPIIACGTSSHANAALAVIRISGLKSLDSVRMFFTLTGPIEPRKVYYTKLVLQGQFYDDICLSYFPGPKSFNGENILELSVHGNTLNVERILNLFVEHAGCRLAGPGEFTYRALKNKKLSLSQVEGLDLFLNANSGYALDQGLSLLSGSLNEIYRELWDLFLIHKSSLELMIDFSDDIGEGSAKEYFFNSLKNFIKKFESVAKRVRPMDHNLMRPDILLAGLPNSGKSSLFNQLLSEERAIVSSRPGTTRDYLVETLVIEGVKYNLIDTAGIRESDDLIEIEGIKRTRKKLSQSFFSILLVNPFEIIEGFVELLKNRFDLILFTHADVDGFAEASEKVRSYFGLTGPIGAISLLDFSSDMENQILARVNKKYLDETSHFPILLDRHKSLILQANSALLSYQQLAAQELDLGILSQELNSLGHCISELIGIVSPEQILNSIFTNFCIGK
jgi:tRNA modification GTPase